MSDFSNRVTSDPDRNHESIQKSLEVRGARWDSLNLQTPDLLALDVEGAEMQVLEGFGDSLREIRWVILEASPTSNFVGGCNFAEVNALMGKSGFRLIATDRFGSGRVRVHLGLKLRSLRYGFRYPIGRRRYQGMINVLYCRILGV